MKIRTIQISGFRKILKATINMEDDITVIAGANNSGKTSIVELFNYVFNSKGGLCCDDFPVYESQEWCTAVFSYFQTQFNQGNEKEDLIENILGTIMPSENPENEMRLAPIEVMIQVDYNPASDDIRNFADYIMELDPDNSSFYFIYRFELDKDLLRKSLDSEYEKLRNRFDKLVGDKLAELVLIIEVVRVADYLCNPKVSTQHGVKGESHDSVVFAAEDSSSNPCVAMYRFFEMWGQIPISAKTLNQFYYDFAAEVDNTQRSIGIKGSELNKKTYMENEEMIKGKLHTVFDRFKYDPYFQFIYGAAYESYFSKPGVTKAKDCLKDNAVYGVLSAYKLFYVGCSRARRNLTILLDSSKIKGNLELQKKRFEEIGFQVIVPQCIRT